MERLPSTARGSVMDVSTVEALAPDQASLKAASKLTGRGKWPKLEESAARNLMWGECQGSGANPYRTVVDLADHGTKCSCPSRKFPCKHALALMWLRAESADAFSAGEPPLWVEEWLGRRRGGGAKVVEGDKSAAVARTKEAPAQADDEKAARRRVAAAEKRARDTARAVDGAMDELDGWLADQLRLGLMGFVAEAGERCRAIAARMVDGKAAALAGRLDELPARLLSLAPEERPRAAMTELGTMALMARAYRAAPDDPDVKRAVRGGDTRESVLNDVGAERLTALWEVAGERTVTRRDGLVAQSTWLLAVATESGAPWTDPPRFALLLDFTPASAGKRASPFAPGETMLATLAFFPSRMPLRAVIAERGESADKPSDGSIWPGMVGDPLDAYARHITREPFAPTVPLVLGPGRVADGAWRGGTVLPLASDVPEPVLGMALDASLATWDGQRLDLLAARTPWGRIAL